VISERYIAERVQADPIPPARRLGSTAHKRDAFLVDALGRFVECVPVCPEEEAGFGTPQEPMRLVRTGGEICLKKDSPSCGLTPSCFHRASSE